MNVEELIRELRSHPQNMEVRIRDYEMNDVDPIGAENIKSMMITSADPHRYRPEIFGDGEKRVIVLN